MGTRRTAGLVAAAATAVLCSALAPTSAPAAPPPSVTLDLASLPAGPPPAMPYFDRATERIHDGSRVVSLRGLQKFTHPTWLWKVDGGYVLDRFVAYDLRPDESQLLFVSNTGKAKILSRHLRPSYADLPLVVSSQYGRVAYAEEVGRDTHLVVNDVPSGKRVSRRSVQFLTIPVTYRSRVLARHLTRAFYWKPGVTAVQTDHHLDHMVAVDLRAKQVAYDERVDRIAPYPPGTGAGWTDPDFTLADAQDPAVVWSTDHRLLATPSAYFEDEHEQNIVRLRRASDGAHVLDIKVGSTTDDGRVYQIWWERADTVLMRIVTNRYRTFVTVRCTTSGSCNRIGTSGSVPTVVPATRNAS